MGWRPLLTGAAAGRAMAAATEIAAATARGLIQYPPGVDRQAAPIWDNVLSGGRAGQSLLHAYLALDGAGESYADTALRFLDQAAEGAAALTMSTSLYLGFPGIAWVNSHLAGRLFIEEEDGNREVDDLLLHALSSTAWKGQYDLFNGLVGVGAYALERLTRPSGVRCLEAVVAELDRRAEHDVDGATFFSPVDTLDSKYQSQFPRGTYILGMAQGIPGVIALLGASCAAGIARNRARPLLAATVSWLLAREQPPESEYRFAHFYLPGFEPYRSRLAWCFGDLGIAASLLVAARGADEPAWEVEARRIARAAAGRTVASSGVPDADLCHGAAGVGHVFNRLYQATGEADLGQAASFWLNHALELRRPGVGIAGFRMASPGGWVDEPGFLGGATGIGLALLAAVSDVDPAWDQLLLLSSLAEPSRRASDT